MAEKNSAPTPMSYRDAGVDIDAGNALVERIKPAVKTTFRPGVLTGLGGFGGLFELDTARFKEPVLVSGTDGVGTKLLLARQLDRHDTIGIDLVAMCVNDILACGAEPLFFLDYFATGRLSLDQAQEVIEGIAAGCREAGCALIGGETAEMPGMYDDGDYDLAGFTVGAVNKTDMIDGSDIRPGHRLLGLASSGPHSNGYSLIRKVLERSGANPAQPLADTTLGEALLAPTRIYVKTVMALLQTHSLDGLAHITGGGITENIVRVIPDNMGISIDLNSWEQPAVFKWLQQQGNIERAEMLRTFNCGIGMVLVVPESTAPAVQQACTDLGEHCVDIGSVISMDAASERVIYQ